MERDARQMSLAEEAEEEEEECGVCLKNIHPDCRVACDSLHCKCVLHAHCAVRWLSSQADPYYHGMSCIYCRKVGSKLMLKGLSLVRNLEAALLESAERFLSRLATHITRRSSEEQRMDHYATCIRLYWWLGYTYEGGLNKTTGKTDENPEGYPELNT
ncbi:hypothetical protein B484DRAFT_481634, partial [Ochromonadaceae sp. CCMP2298]